MVIGFLRPSLLLPSLLLLLPLLPSSVSTVDHTLKRMGTLGKNYNIKKGRPYIQCQYWRNGTDMTSQNCDTDPVGSEFHHKYLGCMKTFRVPDHENWKDINTTGMFLSVDDVELQNAGCWHGADVSHTQCEEEDECIAHIYEDKIRDQRWNGIAFCCCRTHNCNVNATIKFVPGDPLTVEAMQNESRAAETTPTPPQPLSGVEVVASSSLFWIILPIVIGIIAFVAILYALCRCARMKFVAPLTREDEAAIALVAMENGKKRENLKEGLVLGETIVADGKMGRVQKGTYPDPDTGKDRTVVVKTIKDQKSFLLEEAVYKVCANSHNHMVKYLGSNYEPEIHNYYVVLDYMENGSLEDYLKHESFTPMEALTFISSLMDGLAFLHSPSNLPNGGYKSAIVHRDVKSRNVLVRPDRTAAVIDFGLAMICEGNRPHGRCYQVGTHRYMSPELLSGIANCNLEGLKMADVYAAALIIWEILNRTAIEDEELQPSELPYAVEVEEEVAKQKERFEATADQHPNEEFKRKPIMYYLKSIVHGDNRRPVMRERLKSDAITHELYKTVQDMWEFEVEGRISAACANARLAKLKKDAIAGTIPALGQFGFS